MLLTKLNEYEFIEGRGRYRRDTKIKVVIQGSVATKTIYGESETRHTDTLDGFVIKKKKTKTKTLLLTVELNVHRKLWVSVTRNRKE